DDAVSHATPIFLLALRQLDRLCQHCNHDLSTALTSLCDGYCVAGSSSKGNKRKAIGKKLTFLSRLISLRVLTSFAIIVTSRSLRGRGRLRRGKPPRTSLLPS
ncbi:hypothetical protein B296_00010138, partial [Ensete ventricosum]